MSDEPFEWNYNTVKIFVPQEALSDYEAMNRIHELGNAALRRGFDKMQNPWKYSDPVTGWKIELFPRFTAFWNWKTRKITQFRERNANKLTRLADRVRGYEIERDYY